MRRYNDRRPQRKQIHFSPNMVSVVNNAIDNCRVAQLEYDSREKGVTSREVEPMAIVYKNRKRNLVGYCRLRDAYRCFRLDRINIISLKQDTFEPREDFVLEDYQEEEVHYDSAPEPQPRDTGDYHDPELEERARNISNDY